MSRFGSFIKSRPLLSAALGGAVLLAGAGAVSAQFGGWGGGPGGWRDHHGGRGMMGRGARLERMCSMDSARWHPVFRAWVKADLNLTPAQSTEFDKLADVAHPAMEQIKGEVCANFGPAAPKVTPPERLEKAAATMRKAADAMDKAIAPAKAFYNSLDDKQKARVDELTDRRSRMARGDRGGDDRGWGRRWRDQPGAGPQGGPMMQHPGGQMPPAQPAPPAQPPKQ